MYCRRKIPCLFSCLQQWNARRGGPGRWFVAPMQLQSSYKYCTLMHVFVISKINLIIFAFLQETVQLGDGWNRTTFEKSVPMSTYLVCFAVHQFTWVERKSKSGKPVSPSAPECGSVDRCALICIFFLQISFYKNRDILFLFLYLNLCSLFYQIMCKQWSLWPWLRTVFCSPFLSPIFVRSQLVPPIWAHRWGRNTFSKLIPDLKPSDWRNVQVRGYRGVSGHEYKYFIGFCVLKLRLMLLQLLRHRTTVLCAIMYWLLYFTTVATGNCPM